MTSDARSESVIVRTLKGIESLLGVISRLLVQVSTLALWVLTGFVVLSSFMRYFYRRPFNFTEELVSFLFMAMIFLAIPLATIKREHISVPLVVNLLSPGWRRMVEFAAALVMIAFSAIFTWESWKFADFSFEIGARSEQMMMPVGYWQLVMPVGIGLMGIISFVRLLLSFTSAEQKPAPEEPGASMQI